MRSVVFYATSSEDKVFAISVCVFLGGGDFTSASNVIVFASIYHSFLSSVVLIVQLHADGWQFEFQVRYVLSQ